MAAARLPASRAAGQNAPERLRLSAIGSTMNGPRWMSLPAGATLPVARAPVARHR